MSELADSHDIFCNCQGPFAHLLASLFPPGHQDRNLTINQILKRDYKECLSGGDADERPGGAATTNAATLKQEEGDIQEEEKEDIENLLAAAEDAERR